MSGRPFLDSNALLYLIGADPGKAAKARDLIDAGGVVTVQVLNEFTNVARRKQALDWDEIEDMLDRIKQLCEVHSMTLVTHENAVGLARRLQYGIYDAMILAAALEHNCDQVLSEDMQDGQRIDRRLTIRNPFA